MLWQCQLVLLRPVATAAQLLQLDHRAQTQTVDRRQNRGESWFYIITVILFFLVCVTSMVPILNHPCITIANPASGLRVFGGEVREVALSFNGSSHQGDRRKTSQNCSLSKQTKIKIQNPESIEACLQH